MLKFLRKSSFSKWRVHYNILVNGECYSRHLDLPGRTKKDAEAGWIELRDRNFTDEQYILVNIEKI